MFNTTPESNLRINIRKFLTYQESNITNAFEHKKNLIKNFNEELTVYKILEFGSYLVIYFPSDKQKAF